MSSCHKKGFGLIDTLVGVAIFVLVSVMAYGGFLKVVEAVKVLRIKNAAVNLANEQIEIVRNLPYSDVGIVNGIPVGKITREQIMSRSGIDFTILTSVRNIDDPFDGTIGGSPNDLSPADYKSVQITIYCTNCSYTEEMHFYSRVAPIGLESDSNNGALFVQVFDANGQPLQGVDVLIENNSGSENIFIQETTNNSGMFQLIDAPPGNSAYQITVSSGENYSTDKTYTIGDSANPLPNSPHANVVAGQVTQISFAIDRLSDLDIYTRKNTCERIPNINFNIQGSKMIGENVYKYTSNKSTGSNGFLGIRGLEWDNYFINLIGSSWHLAGSSSFLPLQINPNSTQSIDLILAPRVPNALLVKVIDGQTGLPISGANVSIDGPGGESNLITERGFFAQTDWSGGQGQNYFENNNFAYFSSSNIEINNPNGQISLAQFAGNYSSSGFLESAIFDTGEIFADEGDSGSGGAVFSINFGNIFWNPVDQPITAGSESIKIQIATNAEPNPEEIPEGETAPQPHEMNWNFVGPDGTAGTFYTSSGQTISEIHSGDRYLKYKIFLETADNSVTPIISNTSFTFTQECSPPGQVFFSGLSNGNYDLSVSHENYQNFETQILINSDWMEYSVTLTP